MPKLSCQHRESQALWFYVVYPTLSTRKTRVHRSRGGNDDTAEGGREGELLELFSHHAACDAISERGSGHRALRTHTISYGGDGATLG